MKILIQAAAAAITLFATHAAHAQGAVQWRVQDGGNGHWYAVLENGTTLGWSEARAKALARGADLASTETLAEWNFAKSILTNDGTWNRGHGPWLGGYQDYSQPDFAEPAGGWRWVSGQPIVFAAWWPNGPQPSNLCNGSPEDFLHVIDRSNPAWNDIGEPSTCQVLPPRAAVLEWSADCNGDGIVDYGQCRDGSLPDYDGDNIPDCCEAGAPCVVGNYPVQWRAEDGGNGHWYATSDQFGTWDAMRALAISAGGDLASLGSIEENQAANRVRRASDAITGGGPWIGARKLTGDPWTWSDGTAWSFTNWAAGEPCCGDAGLYVHLYPSGEWNDHNQTQYTCRALIEWSADCNSDGIVDHGQILQGQLADTNADGVPDICQGPTCADADIYRDFNVNGADLGILLSQWGPNTPLTESDLNGDGVVNGADLGLLLSFWGACP